MIRGEEDLETNTNFTNKEQNDLQVYLFYFGGSKKSPIDKYARIVKCNTELPTNTILVYFV